MPILSYKKHTKMVQFVEGDLTSNNQDFELLSDQDIHNLKHFGKVEIPTHLSRIIKQVYEVRRPYTLQVQSKTTMNGFPLYVFEYGVGVLVKGSTGLWLMKTSPQLITAVDKALKS